ncbi:zincin [Crucibulum laeve]|uniref:Zincin n=1 Tax=Crucibulum laeve TaxID=68775 RepID=A0A5C3LKF0_9AGAR|nr:zincin [Crucibulum laeve]
MLFALRAAFFFILGVAIVSAGPLEPRPTRKCASAITPARKTSAAYHFTSHRIHYDLKNIKGPHKPIDVYFHVIQKDNTTTGGNIKSSQIDKQLQILNHDYSSTGLFFRLKKVSRTLNSTWFRSAGPFATYDIQSEMKKKLRVGGRRDLNIFTVGFETGDTLGSLGYANYPIDYARVPWDDGVVILYSSLPGGTMESYNEGRTATHEVGHWAGLYHTFQGGCEGDNDEVDDTPAQANPTYGCPAGVDTCPGGGVDPIHNFMDYSFDSCMSEFTKGQVARIRDQMATYRNSTS